MGAAQRRFRRVSNKQFSECRHAANPLFGTSQQIASVLALKDGAEEEESEVGFETEGIPDRESETLHQAPAMRFVRDRS